MADLIVTSKLTAKCQTVLPKRAREHLGLRPGDVVHYVLRDDGIVIERLGPRSGRDSGPFAAFDEWSSEADRRAFADL